jgi:hypothetical protein
MDDAGPTELALGGLHFAASFRGQSGATLRVLGPVDGVQRELLRFDDFMDGPHYHFPADAEPVGFDQAALGEPLDWLVVQMRDHLGQVLIDAGWAAVLPDLDLSAVTANAERIRKLMTDCLPDGYVRVSGVGLRRVEA